ncbi:PD-(D/E)XK nuclease family transposase [Beggiatoa leptomitoformis]|uniref:Rpn family recombination-promoting nuclease/putative transposase n=1 Tax=Beggiatoa leptomitoformis TaxID=288004 RepID=A0A2N9YDK4_9GAMM|nr:PD-(D/E)XK nuclease family transposase [Beggiatoa leptomitoformis]AUI68561.1 hypothetical protein BLE401_07480 [Beggiatoa leptomitoformis]QGX03834.1 hypothetical protein AL038_16760 [Beggiatoa leptomitoformis]
MIITNHCFFSTTNAIYTVGILDFVFDEDKEDQDVFHHEVKLIDQSTKRVFYDKLTYIYLEMPKFTKTENELETHFDKWLYILRNLENLTNRPKKLQEKIFGKLFEQAEIANYTDQEYAEYEESLKVYRDLKNVIDTAFDEGKAEGLAEGLAEGIEKGLAQGIEKGLAEGMEKGKDEAIRLTALQLKQEGIPHEIIAKVTGLTIKIIDELS